MTDSYERDELSPSAFSGKQLNRFTRVFLTIIKEIAVKKYNTHLIDLFGSVVMADALNV